MARKGTYFGLKDRFGDTVCAVNNLSNGRIMHLLDFGKVGLRRISNIRRMPDFGKALFSGIWAFLAGIWTGARSWGGGKPPKRAASRPKGQQATRLTKFR